MRGARVLGWCLAGILVLASSACGDQDAASTDGESGSASSSQPASQGAAAPEGPACSEIWRDGGTLPQRYRGCVEDGKLVRSDAFECSSGQVLVTYADRYYAVLGGPVNDVGAPLQASRQYRSAWRSCSA